MPSALDNLEVHSANESMKRYGGASRDLEQSGRSYLGPDCKAMLSVASRFADQTAVEKHVSYVVQRIIFSVDGKVIPSRSEDL